MSCINTVTAAPLAAGGHPLAPLLPASYWSNRFQLLSGARVYRHENAMAQEARAGIICWGVLAAPPGLLPQLLAHWEQSHGGGPISSHSFVIPLSFHFVFSFGLRPVRRSTSDIMSFFPLIQAGDASGTGFLDVAGRCWESRAADLVDPKMRALLPQLLKPNQVPLFP